MQDNINMADIKNHETKVTVDQNLNNENQSQIENGMKTAEDAEVLSLRNENSDLKDRLLRTIADMENLKKRTEKEKQDTIKYSLEKVMQDLIPIIDVFSTALKAERDKSKEENSLLAGTEMVFKQLIQSLKKHGLEMHDSLGKDFDPNLHQAIQKVEDTDVKGEVVKQVFGEAFTLHGRLIRPAMVVVASQASN